MIKRKAIVFDYDGVIVDSEVWFAKSVQGFLKENGINVEKEELTCLMGRPVKEAYQIMKEKYNIKQDYETCMHDMWKYYDEAQNEKGSGIMPDLIPFLNWLKSNGILTALATSAFEDHLEDLNEKFNFEWEFKEQVLGKDVTAGKPNPEVYNKMIAKLEKYGIQKDEIAVVEDSYNGILSAKNAGLFVFGFKESSVKQDTHMADVEVNNYKEIEDYLKGE